MNSDGTRIYFEGLGENKKYDKKIRKIVDAIRLVSPSSEVSMRFLKTGNLYEGMLWGKASHVPIGVYNRGRSMSKVLDSIFRKVQKDALKVSQHSKSSAEIRKSQGDTVNSLAMAS